MHVIVEPHRNIYNNTGKPVFTVVVATNSSSLSAGEMDDFIKAMETAQQVALYFESILNEEGWFSTYKKREGVIHRTGIRFLCGFCVPR